ncbi:MAG: glutamate formimidoyltransferase [candidate division WOR-3 bacterium]|nr:glutamate formimidoyltransferase [candidate division WOR-3 bacterium]MCX7948273.1 glutamate formimidoyltransferase [candidate division WOR-3 bacterium]MDW8150952.1 glutamate formimidoyltransferase [candidate division WOR-3 bacterium]
MKIPLIECIPNFSEGRRKEVIDAIVDSANILGIEILDIHSDKDHNRSVLTLIGVPHQVEEAILNMFEKAIELIDLNQHTGTHPRIGAIDVVPIVPIRNISIDEAVKLSRRLGKKIYERFGIPIFFYEHSAKRPDRKDLPSIRNIGFERLKEEIIYDDYRIPDIGERRLHPSAGATVIGVRDFLIAYNILIDTDDIEVAKKIAYKIREKTGYFKGIRVIGMFLAEKKKCQISINVYQPEIVDLDILLYNVEKLSKIYGTRVLESEIVGLAPYENIERVFKNTLKIRDNVKNLAIEKRIFDNVDELKLLISSIGSRMPNMGGGLAGGISLALGISLWRKAMLISKDINYDIKKIDQYIDKALNLSKKDSEAFEKLLKEKNFEALESCINVSMDFAHVCINVLNDIETIVENVSEDIISDLGIALELIRSALNSSKYNILINLKHSENEEYNRSVLNNFRQIEERFIFLYEALTSKISLRL